MVMFTLAYPIFITQPAPLFLPFKMELCFIIHRLQFLNQKMVIIFSWRYNLALPSYILCYFGIGDRFIVMLFHFWCWIPFESIYFNIIMQFCERKSLFWRLPTSLSSNVYNHYLFNLIPFRFCIISFHPIPANFYSTLPLFQSIIPSPSILLSYATGTNTKYSSRLFGGVWACFEKHDNFSMLFYSWKTGTTNKKYVFYCILR
jgi:hypothetical protein